MPPCAAYASDLSPEYPLLGFLAQQPAHGYELHQRLVADLSQIWRVSLSQTYNILKRLEEQGYITGTVQEQEKLPSRRQFHLTPAGRRRFNNWLHSFASYSLRAVRVEFTTRLYFAHALDPDLLPDLIKWQTNEIQSGLAQLRTMLTEIPPEKVFNRLGLELRIRQLSSLLDWIADCRVALGLQE